MEVACGITHSRVPGEGVRQRGQGVRDAILWQSDPCSCLLPRPAEGVRGTTGQVQEVLRTGNLVKLLPRARYPRP